MGKIVILENHFEGKDTIAYKDHVRVGFTFFNLREPNEVCAVLEEKGMPIEKWKEVLDAVFAGKGNTADNPNLAQFACEYCCHVEDDLVMRDIIIKNKDPFHAYNYCRYVKNSPDMRQIILDSGDSSVAYFYCRHISNDPDMVQVIINAKDAQNAFHYCMDVMDTEELREVILGAKSAQWALSHYEELGSDPRMKELVLKIDDPAWQIDDNPSEVEDPLYY